MLRTLIPSFKRLNLFRRLALLIAFPRSSKAGKDNGNDNVDDADGEWTLKSVKSIKKRMSYMNMSTASIRNGNSQIHLFSTIMIGVENFQKRDSINSSWIHVKPLMGGWEGLFFWQTHKQARHFDILYK